MPGLARLPEIPVIRGDQRARADDAIPLGLETVGAPDVEAPFDIGGWLQFLVVHCDQLYADDAVMCLARHA